MNKEEKRRHIALAAVEVFGDKGFEKTRMNDVAKAADVGKGTLYEYFRGKKELMDGAMEALMGHMLEALLPKTDSSASSLETLESMTKQTVSAMHHVAGAYRFFLEYMLITGRSGNQFSGLRDLLMDYRNALTDIIEIGIEGGEIRADVNPAGAAAAFAAWFDGAIFHWLVLPEEGSLEELGDAYIDMVVRGLSSSPAHGERSAP